MDKPSIHLQVTDSIVVLLERGTLPWRQTWKTSGGTASPVPANLVTGRAYRGINRIILWTSTLTKGYPSHAWATYRRIAQAGGHIRKGERGTQVVLYRPYVLRDSAQPGETVVHHRDVEADRAVWLMRSFTVFNAAQCGGLPQVTTPVAPPEDAIPAARQFLAHVNAAVQHGGDRACYLPSDDRIHLPSFDAFTSPEAYYATSLHEHVHWTGNRSRLNRLEQGAAYGSPAYAFEELTAELGAAFLCADLSIRGDLEHHASYLQSWLTVLKQDPKALFRAAADANRATDYLVALQPRSQQQAA
jgi:antirestriction protein ArdC